MTRSGFTVGADIKVGDTFTMDVPKAYHPMIGFVRKLLGLRPKTVSRSYRVTASV